MSANLIQFSLTCGFPSTEANSHAVVLREGSLHHSNIDTFQCREVRPSFRYSIPDCRTTREDLRAK